MASTAKNPANARPSGQTILLATVVVTGCALVGYLLTMHGPASAAHRAALAAPQDRLTLADIPFDGRQAFDYLRQLCAIGTRVSASQGMLDQQKLLAEHFEKLGAKVSFQRFRVRHPIDGSPVSMANLIVQWHPERNERILLCTHFDTRPFPDRDPRNPRGTFLGANDGASGTALLMELGNGMPKLDGKLGVDFVFFDGEEFVFEEGHPYFIGSEYFALTYARKPGGVHYRWAVLLDMVGDADLQIVPDRHSMSWADSRPLVQSIWKTAERLGVTEFDIKQRCDVLDDHLKLHNIGKIPSCDLIDFRYPWWHTEGDLPERCSALSLAKVGWVVQTWLEQAIQQ
ncbi:MAG: M28 family peptidase [Pirellulales bacterium]